MSLAVVMDCGTRIVAKKNVLGMKYCNNITQDIRKHKERDNIKIDELNIHWKI